MGGVGVVIRNLALDQLRRGAAVAVAAPGDGPVLDELLAAGVRVFPWNARPQPGPGVPRELVQLVRILDAFGPHILHLHSSKAGLVGRLLVRRRRPTIMQPHSWSFWARTGAVRRATVLWERSAARWADVVLCVSEDERRLGEKAGVRARYAVIRNGIDLGRFSRPGDGDRREARRRLALGEEPLAVCVGRLHRQKNQSVLLDVWPSVRAAVPGARLVLVGDGRDRDALAARSVDGVTLVGSFADVRPWLAAATVVVLPSRWEAGMSLAAMEAMAAGRSVVATDVAGMREGLGNGAGAVVPVADSRALIDAVAARLRDAASADAEGRVGRRHVEAHHDLRRQHMAVAELYDDLLLERSA